MKSGGSSGLHPTLRNGAKDGAPDPLGLVTGWATRLIEAPVLEYKNLIAA